MVKLALRLNTSEFPRTWPSDSMVKAWDGPLLPVGTGFLIGPGDADMFGAKVTGHKVELCADGSETVYIKLELESNFIGQVAKDTHDGRLPKDLFLNGWTDSDRGPPK